MAAKMCVQRMARFSHSFTMYGKRHDYNGANAMRPTERLLEHLNRAFGGEAWYGPALRDLLDGVSEAQSRERPIKGGHSIVELVVHIRTWMDVVARRISPAEEQFTTVEDWSDISGTT